MVVYAPSDKKGLLYQVYLEEKDHRPSIFIGELGTLKREGKEMVPDEIWGGVGTYYDVKRLLRKLSSKPAVMVSEDQVREGPLSCVSQR